MNLRGFKKSSENDESATFTNRHGHSIVVAKKNLSPALLEELEALPVHMAKGGEVKAAGSSNSRAALKEWYDKKKKKPKKFASGSDGDTNPLSSDDSASAPGTSLTSDIPTTQPTQFVAAPAPAPASAAPADTTETATTPEQTELMQSYNNIVMRNAVPLTQSGGSVDLAPYQFGTTPKDVPNFGVNPAVMDQAKLEVARKKAERDFQAERQKLAVDKENAARSAVGAPVLSGGSDTVSPTETQNSPAPAGEQPPQGQASTSDLMQQIGGMGGVPSGGGYGGGGRNGSQYYQVDPQQVSQDIMKEGQAYLGDLTEGHITPKTYSDLFAKNSDGSEKSFLGKMGTFFGLLLSGAGSGLAHQPNMVMGMMNNEISNDLDAQKASATNQQNFYRLNLQHQLQKAQIKTNAYKTAMDAAKVPFEQQQMASVANYNNVQARVMANADTRVQMNWSTFHNFVQKVSKMPPGSPERIQGEQTLALMSKQIEGMNLSIADKAATAAALLNQTSGLFGQDQGAGGASGPNSEAQFQKRDMLLNMTGAAPEATKLMEATHMPGVQGRSSTPLTTDDHNKITAAKTFFDQLDQLRDFAQAHEGSVDPRVMAAGAAYANNLSGAYRNMTAGGVYKSGEQDFIGKMIDPDPTKFFNNIRGVIPKLDATRQYFQTQHNDFLSSKGFPKQPVQSTPVPIAGGKTGYRWSSDGRVHRTPAPGGTK